MISLRVICGSVRAYEKFPNSACISHVLRMPPNSRLFTSREASGYNTRHYTYSPIKTYQHALTPLPASTKTPYDTIHRNRRQTTSPSVSFFPPQTPSNTSSPPILPNPPSSYLLPTPQILHLLRQRLHNPRIKLRSMLSRKRNLLR